MSSESVVKGSCQTLVAGTAMLGKHTEASQAGDLDLDELIKASWFYLRWCNTSGLIGLHVLSKLKHTPIQSTLRTFKLRLRKQSLRPWGLNWKSAITRRSLLPPLFPHSLKAQRYRFNMFIPSYASFKGFSTFLAGAPVVAYSTGKYPPGTNDSDVESTVSKEQRERAETIVDFGFFTPKKPIW